MNAEGVALRPRGLGGVVDLGVVLLRAEARRVLAGALPLAALALLAGAAAWRLDPWAGLALAALLSRAAQVPVTRALGARASGVAPVGGLWSDLGRGVVVSVGLLVVYATALCFFPIALWLAYRSVFMPEVALLERPATGLWSRAAAVSESPGSHAFGIVTWLAAIEAFGLVAGEACGRALVGDLLMIDEVFANPEAVEPSLYGLAGVVVVQPLRAAVRFAGYLDARTRAEALDVFFALRVAANDAVRR